MTFTVSRLERSDLEEAADVQDRAFATTSRIYSIKYPNGSTPAVKADILDDFKQVFDMSIASCYKVMDSENVSKIVSIIVWKTYQDDQPESEWNRFDLDASKWESDSQDMKTPDIDKDFARKYSVVVGSVKRKHIHGRARVHLEVLVTHPDYHRRGLGKMLLDICAEHAIELGLPTYLEASPLAAGLYRREGFVDIDGAVAKMDLSPYGYNEVHQNAVMIRPPISRS